MSYSSQCTDERVLTTVSFDLSGSSPDSQRIHGPWEATIATMASWPRDEAAQPTIERRIWRTGRARQVRDHLIVRLHDQVGLMPAAEAHREMRELLRPIGNTMALRRLGSSAQERSDQPCFSHFAELAHIDADASHGLGRYPGLFHDLMAGLAANSGPVALSLAVTPFRSTEMAAEDFEDGRVVSLRILLAARGAIPASVRARVEALWTPDFEQSHPWTTRHARPPEPMPLPVSGRAQSVVGLRVAAATMALAWNTPGRSDRLGSPMAGPVPADGTPLGWVWLTNGKRARWRLGWDQRLHHTMILGGSGAGKSTLGRRLIHQDVDLGRAVVVIDPHGDLVDDLTRDIGARPLRIIDPRRANSDPLDLLDHDPARAAAHLGSAMADVWPAEFSGPTWTRGISLALRCLYSSDVVEARPTLGDLDRFLVDARWRAEVIHALPAADALRQEAEYESKVWTQSGRDDHSMVTWLSGKFTSLVHGPAAAIFTRNASSTLEDILADDAPLLISLPVGILGGEQARLALRMLLTRLLTAVTGQATRPREDRRPVSLFIDEAHLLAGPALAATLAQARKFNCAVTVSTQAPSQFGAHLPEMLTNASTLLAGHLSARETSAVAERLDSETEALIGRLPRYHFVASLQSSGAPPVVLHPLAAPRA